MNYILSKKYDETFTISFIGTENLNYTGNTNLHLLIDEPISGVSKISGITYTLSGTIDDTQYLKLYFKFNNSGSTDKICCDRCWSNMLPIEELSGLTLNSNQLLNFELFVYRIDDIIDGESPTDIWISNIVIYGDYEISKTEELAIISNTNNTTILSPIDTYKVFSIDNFEVIYRGLTSNINIKYRVTQNNGRSYSEWELLTTENISTYRFNELRFAKIEYLITQINSSLQLTKIYDIILIGDFQNVSANYLKNNRYGLRQDCLSVYYNQSTSFSCGIPTYSNSSNINTNNSEYDLKMNFDTRGLSCYIQSNTPNELNIENHINQNTMWNPYESSKITNLANKIANDINNIFAWDIDYHLTDPDEGGIDMSLHEYQLFNIIDVKTIKVLIPSNKFPDNTIKISKFNLDLFDTFEIHILKDIFKNHFGISKRPGENDIIFFCELNRLYRVKHAQVYREIMNAGIYWKVILEKYEQKSNIRNLSDESKIKIDNLTKNTTMDEIFGAENQDEMNKISNKDQTKPITRETMRDTIYKDVIITNESIYNGNINFADYYYNFKDALSKISITYKKYDKELKKSENRSFISWFNFNNGYIEDEFNEKPHLYYNINNTKNFNLLNNFDEISNTGYRYWYHKNRIIFQVNESFYQLPVLLKTNIWYGLIINLNQRSRELTMSIFKRPGDYNIKMLNPDTYEEATVSSTNTTGLTYLIDIGFKQIDNQEIQNISTDFELIESILIDVIPDEFIHNKNIELIGSNIKYTNLRIFNDVVPENKINNILNQLIIVDSNKLILADNSNRRLYADNFKTNRWD